MQSAENVEISTFVAVFNCNALFFDMSDFFNALDICIH